MRRLSTLLFLALTAALPAQQKPAVTVQLPPKPLLPMSFAGWTATNTPVESSKPADDIFIPDQNMLNELGFKRFATADYRKGSEDLHMEALQFEDATGAYGFFAGNYDDQNGDVKPHPVRTPYDPHNCSSGRWPAQFRRGDTVVIAVHPCPIPPQFGDELTVLANMLPIPTGSRAELPKLPGYLPTSGLFNGSQRYSVGPAGYEDQSSNPFIKIPAELIDFSRDAETITADYTIHGKNGGLLLIEYPTPQMAIERAAAIQNAGNKPEPYLLEDGPVVTSIARTGPIVAVAAGYFTQKDADTLAHSVHYEAEVTWNHTEGYVSDAWRAAHLYLGIFALAGILCAASVILGLFFGGARAILRVMRGKSASAVEDTEFISLDLGHGGDYRSGPKN